MNAAHNPKIYGVQKNGQWLKLVGPFKYAEWVDYKGSITEPMTYGGVLLARRLWWRGEAADMKTRALGGAILKLNMRGHRDIDYVLMIYAGMPHGIAWFSTPMDVRMRIRWPYLGRLR